MAVTREQIVRAAAAMVDEVGIDGVTLRALAGHLGISAPTLYWHVRDKRHLMDLVAEQVLADMAPGDRHAPRPGESVTEWLGEVARQQRAVLLAHRDSVRVVAGNRPTESALPGIEQTLRVLVDAGLEPGEAVRVLTAIGSFVIGDVLETQAAADRPADDDPADPVQAEYPLLTRATATIGSDDDRFTEGLTLLMDGLQARLDRRVDRR